MPPQAASAPRKTLEAQIDRLDKILDGLADALEQAVTTAVKEAVGQVVSDAVKEVALSEPPPGSSRRMKPQVALPHWSWRVWGMVEHSLRAVWALRLPALLLLVAVLSVSLTSFYLGPIAAGVAAGLVGLVLVVSICMARPADSESARLPMEMPTPSENGEAMLNGRPSRF